MSDAKMSFNLPAAVVTASEISTPATKTPSYKKHATIVVSGIVAMAIILAAILVGMHLFNEAQKDIVRLSLNWDKDTKTELSADPNTNIVQYHATGLLYEAWIVDDFNRDIRVLKVQSDSFGTNCYATPLNRSQATDPSHISALSKHNSLKSNSTVAVYYQTAPTPIPDFSFSSKIARNMCDGISTYWLYPRCDAQKTAGVISERKKRCTEIIILWVIIIRTC